MQTPVELALVTRLAGVPVVIGRLRDAELVRRVAELVIECGLQSDDAGERQQAALMVRLMRTNRASVM